MGVSSTWILSLKVLLISTGVVSIAFGLKLYAPLVLEFSVSQLPLLWSSILSWLKPPYLYVIINGIIITIVASSRFHKNHGDLPVPPPAAKTPADLAYEMKNRAEISSEFGVLDSTIVYEQSEEVVEARVFENSVVVNGVRVEDEGADEFVISRSTWKPPKRMDSWEISSEITSEKPLVSARLGHRKPVRADEIRVEDEGADEFVMSRSTWKPPQMTDSWEIPSEIPSEKPLVSARLGHRKPVRADEVVISSSTWKPPKMTDSWEIPSEMLSEKPLVSARFGHRKPVRASPEGGKALRVSKPKRHETLENTWKTITEGRAMPLTRHLKKFETCQMNVSPLESTPVKTAETFKDRTKKPSPIVRASPGSGKLRKEPSLGQDELTRRVEAFIKNFNQEMRLQRQESLNQYTEMIGQGSQ